MDKEFNPDEWGYKASQVQPFDQGWIIASLDLPVIAADAGGLWYCPIETIYDSKWMPTAIGLLG